MKRAVGKGEKREVQLEKEKVGKSRWKEQNNRNCKERKKRKKNKVGIRAFVKRIL